MKKTIKAAILVEQRNPLIIDDIELPEKLNYGQVLVNIKYSGICGSQLGEIDGVKGEDKYLPHLLGHEGSGIVEAIGEGVSRLEPGDHVVIHWRKSSGIEATTPKYKWKDKFINAGHVTTFNEYAVISENRLTKIPNNVDLKIAALFGCAVTTAMGIVNNDAKIKIGESVVIFGLGGVGLNLVQAAAMVSAHPIIGIDLSDSKIMLAKEFGLTDGFNASKYHDITSHILALTGQAGADVVIDTTGNTRVIETAYQLTQPAGKTILVGVPKSGDNINIYSLPLHFRKSLVGSHGGNAIPDEDIPRYLKLLSQGKLNLNGLISAEYSLTDINTAIDHIRDGSIAGRVMINLSANK